MAFLDKTGLEHLWAHIVSKINDTKIIVDDALSSTSMNPVQNKVINATISNLSQLVNDAVDTASGAVATHNTSDTAHTDLRALIEGLTNRLNALADSDDTTLDQLSEIVTYIKSNKALIDAVTTGKVSVSDIVDNLTTNASGKVLSAAQGVALKAMIDGIVIPTALPNPQPITISGQRYDGSEAVDVEIPEGYTLPIASAAQLGGVKPAEKTGEMTQAVGVDESGGLWTMKGSGESAWRIIRKFTLEENVSDHFDITTDSEGNAFSCSELLLFIFAQSATGSDFNLVYIPNGIWTSGTYCNSASKVPSNYRATFAFHAYAYVGQFWGLEEFSRDSSNGKMYLYPGDPSEKTSSLTSFKVWFNSSENVLAAGSMIILLGKDR